MKDSVEYVSFPYVMSDLFLHMNSLHDSLLINSLFYC